MTSRMTSHTTLAKDLNLVSFIHMRIVTANAGHGLAIPVAFACAQQSKLISMHVYAIGVVHYGINNKIIREFIASHIFKGRFCFS